MNIIDYLIENGGCSIKYRTMRDILGYDINSGTLLSLQTEILNKHWVKKLFANQHPDGWIGKELHGGRVSGLDSSVMYLLSQGVEKSNPTLQRVVDAILSDSADKPYRDTFRGGDALDMGGRGGNEAIKAEVLSNLGAEDNDIVQNQINIALRYLKDSLSYKTVDDFSLVNKKGERYYTPDAHLPGANHLKILNDTDCWRTLENHEILKKSLCHCFNLMEDAEYITFKAGTHFVGPFNVNWQLHRFNISRINDDSYALVWWLRNLYRFSNLGMIQDVPQLNAAYDYLYTLFTTVDVVNLQTEKSLGRFKDILSVETSWRNPKTAYCDIMFYCAVVLHNAGYDICKLQLTNLNGLI